MGRALGITSQLLAVVESTYYTNPGGNFRKLPFNSGEFGADQGLIEDDILGLGRDPSAVARDVINVGGSVTVPIDLINIGFWLRLLLGDATTTGAGDYTHTFVSGGTPESATMEFGFPNADSSGLYFLHKGVMVNSMRVQMQRSGLAQATFDLLGKDETKATSSGGGTPASETVTRFNQFQGSVQRNDVAIAGIVSADFTFSNGMEPVEIISSDGLIEGVDALQCSLGGSMTVRFQDDTLYDDAVNDTAVELEFTYSISGTKEITFRAHEVKLPRVRRRVDGPGGVEVTYNWQAQKDTAEGEMFEVVLKNQTANYDNPA